MDEGSPPVFTAAVRSREGVSHRIVRIVFRTVARVVVRYTETCMMECRHANFIAS